MSWRSALDEALTDVDGDRVVDVDGEGGTARIDVAEAEAIGVRVRGVRMRRERVVDVGEEAHRLAGGLRCLPDTLCPVEVEPRLGGATLRSHPDAMRNREFFELDLSAEEAHLSRKKVGDDGYRSDVDWTMTRDDLGRLLDELG